MVEFKLRHLNRLEFPERDILICEDDIHHQMELMNVVGSLFERQGKVQIHLTPSSVIAAHIISSLRPRLKLIILDHDLPVGNASDLLHWMREKSITDIPIITASGIATNNSHMKKLCEEFHIECHFYDKFDVIEGRVNQLVKNIVNR